MYKLFPSLCRPLCPSMLRKQSLKPKWWMFSPFTLIKSNLYVATNLSTLLIDQNDDDSDVEKVFGTACYRRLNPEYYAWLRHRMIVAKKSAAQKRMAPATYKMLSRKFEPVHQWAVRNIGKHKLQSAIAEINTKTYQPPAAIDPTPQSKSKFVWPEMGDWPFVCQVTAKAVAKVDVIRKKALELGWTENQLYQNRGRFKFPLGKDYGLVCFVHGNRTIGELGNKAIEIIGPMPCKNSLSFRREHFF